jgi:hypothetical protein
MSGVLGFIWFVVKWVLIILGLIFLYIIWAFNNIFGSRYVNKDIDSMIEAEYKKSLNRFNLLVYRNLSAGSKKKRLDGFIKKNPDLVDKIKKEALQNSVNAVIAKHNSVSSGGDLQAIIDIASESFNITLSNGKVIPIRPVIKKVSLWTPERNGYILYDAEATISQFKEKINGDDNLIAEGVMQINNTLKDYSECKYKSASITAVATALIRD